MAETMPPDDVKAAVLTAALKGVPGIQICRENSITGDLLRSILVDHGWPNRKATKWRLEVLLEDIASAGPPRTYDEAAAQPRAAELSPGTPEASGPPPSEVCSHVSLLTAAAGSRHSRTRLSVARIERLLEDLEARIREEVADPVTRPDATAAEIRQWALSTGVPCPQMGRLPHSVRHAYATAHARAERAS